MANISSPGFNSNNVPHTTGELRSRESISWGEIETYGIDGEAVHQRTVPADQVHTAIEREWREQEENVHVVRKAAVRKHCCVVRCCVLCVAKRDAQSE